MHSALETVLELSLAAAACMNLGFDDNIDIAELTRDLLCFIERRGDLTSRCCHVESLQQLFRLILVNVHCTDWRALSRETSVRQPFFMFKGLDRWSSLGRLFLRGRARARANLEQCRVAKLNPSPLSTPLCQGER